MRIAATILILTAAAALASPWQMVIARKKANAGGGAATVELTDYAATNSFAAAETWTISGLDIGPDVAGRVIVLCITYRANPAVYLDIVEMGGSDITGGFLVGNTNFSGSIGFHAVQYVATPSGTSTTVAVSNTGSWEWADVAIYRLTGVSGTVYDTALHDAAATTIDVASGGVVIGAGSSATTGPAATMTGLTEDRDVETAANSDTAAYGSYGPAASAESGRSVRINMGSTTYDAAVFSSWEP